MPYRPSSARFLDEDDEWQDQEDLGWTHKLEEPKVYAAGVTASAPRNRTVEATPERPTEPATPAASARKAPERPEAGDAPDAGDAINTEDELVAVFKAIDADGSGSITVEELNKVLRRYVNKHIMQEEVEKLVAKADRDHDGKVDIQEFLSIVKSGALGGLAPDAEATGAQPPAPDGEAPDNGRKQVMSYKVTIHTGTDSGAGTDANVWVQIFGTTGISEKTELGNGEGLFEKGSADEFDVSVKDVGQVVKISIGHDNTGPGAGWQLGHVVVTEVREDSAAPASYKSFAPKTSDDSDGRGGPNPAAEVEIHGHTEGDAGSLMPGPGGGGGGMATSGFGGNPPASLTKSVEQLVTLTEEVGKIRDSLLQIERPAAAAGGGAPGGGGRRGLAPITPDRRAGGAVQRPKKLKGLAGVIAARNERDKKRMDELVKLVQSSLGAMETSLEARLEKLESRVGEVRCVPLCGLSCTVLAADRSHTHTKMLMVCLYCR